MKWEWAIGEVILLVLAFWELWSLRKYDRPAKGDKPKDSGS